MYNPPPGPPPGYDQEPPPYHNWQDQVPDTSSLPPPPSISHFASETGNASGDDAGLSLSLSILYFAFCIYESMWTNVIRPRERVLRFAAAVEGCAGTSTLHSSTLHNYKSKAQLTGYSPPNPPTAAHY